MLKILSSIRVYLLCLFSACGILAEFSKHGLYWSATTGSTATISTNGKWSTIENATMTVVLEVGYTVLVSYSINMEGLKLLLENPLPREDSKDMLQVRCLVDGMPYRSSSSYVSSYATEDRFVKDISGTFVANMSEGTHIVNLQWKKLGTQMSKWRIAYDGDALGYSLTALADFEGIYGSMESSDRTLFGTGVWKDLSDTLSFSLSDARDVIVGYSFVAQPQLASFIKDRSMEYIHCRIVIDGNAFSEGSSVLGAASWNPFAGTMRSFTKLPFSAGSHQLKLQWRKTGTVFESWGSNPSYLDGFASARNLFAIVQPIDGPIYQNHERSILKGDGNWKTVGNKLVSFTLVKQSAVLFTYSLPVSQYGNPSLDSNVWGGLVDVRARLLVDNIPYKNTVQPLSTTSRAMGEISGSLGLILEKGSHSAALQWSSDGVDWTTLNDLTEGFMTGEELLVFISSENAQPTITVTSSVIYGVENTEISLRGVSVEDVDEQLKPGMYVQFSLSVSHGRLGVGAAPLFANKVHLVTKGNGSVLTIADNIANVNDILTSITYTPTAYWSGNDLLIMNLTDLGNVGFGDSLSASAELPIVVEHVDYPFTLQVPSAALVVLSGETVPVSPLLLEDIDSQTSVFRAQLVAFCGYLTINKPASFNITFILGGGPNENAIDFYGMYGEVRGALQEVVYRARPTCSMLQRGEVIILKVINTDNLTQNISEVLPVTIVAVNSAPIVTMQDFPRWTLKGLKLIPSPDAASASFEYLQMHANIASSVQLSADDTLDISNQQVSSEMSEIAIISGEYDTYVLRFRYGNWSAKLLSSDYVPVDSVVTLQLAVDELSGQLDEYGFACLLNGELYAAEMIEQKGVERQLQISCNVIIPPSISSETVGSSTHDDVLLTAMPSARVAWIQVAAFNTSGLLAPSSRAILSDYIPLFVYPQPEIIGYQPVCVFRSARQSMEIAAQNTATLTSCFFAENISSSAFTITAGRVRCAVPVLPVELQGSIELRLVSNDGNFQSSLVKLGIAEDPLILSVITVSRRNRFFLVVGMQWNPLCIQLPPRCMIDELYLDMLAFNSSAVVCALATVDVTRLSSGSATISILLGSITLSSSYRMVPPSNSSKDETENPPVSLSVHSLSRVSLFEGSFLVVSGEGLRRTCLMCSFGLADNTILVPAVAVSTDDDEAVSCLVPTGAMSPFAVQSYDNRSRSNEFDVTIKPLPKLLSISSSIGSTTGGEVVTILGKDFTADADTLCNFGHQSVSAIFVTEQELACIVPSNSAGIVNVTLTVDDILVYPSATLYYTYESPIEVYGVSPRVGLVLGGSVVIISGRGFANSNDTPADNRTHFCKFGSGSPIPANVISDSKLSCSVPQADAKGSVSLIVVRTLNGSFATGAIYSSPLTFLYVSAVAEILNVNPLVSTRDGGDVVTVTGVSFFVAESSFCLFGNESVQAVVRSESVLECVSPALPESSWDLLPINVPFGVSLDGYEVWSSKVTFTYVTPTVVRDVQPLKGSTQGGTKVSVTGSGFRFESLLWCVFGVQYVKASFVSSNELWCLSPPQQQGAVSFSLIVDKKTSLFASSKGGNVFTYVETPKMMSVIPLAGSVSGGSVLEVSVDMLPSDGRGDGDVLCYFGDVSVQAVVVSTTTISCTSPASQRSGKVVFKIFVDGEPLLGSVKMFTYTYPMTVLTANPLLRGSKSGGWSTIIFGAGFFNASIASCLFGDQTSPAVVLNNSAIECVVPAALTLLDDNNESVSTSVSVGVSLDGYEVWSSSAVFTYVSPAIVKSLSPSSGSTQGGTNVSVSGSGFLFGSPLWCVFGQERVRASFASSDQLWCLSPPQKLGEVDFSVWADGVAAESISAEALSFEYLANPFSMDLSPSACVVGGGNTVLIITGAWSSLLPRTGDLYCQVEAVKSLATIVNETVVTCPAPPWNSMGDSALFLTSAYGARVAGPLVISYVVPAVITFIWPQTGSVNGGGHVFVYGFSFFEASQAFCLFGDQSVPALVINTSTIECIYPALLGNSSQVEAPTVTVPVGVSLNGYEVWASSTSTSTSTNFTYVSPVRVTSMWPLVGSTHGGALVSVTGTGFRENALFECSFGSTSVPGWFVSSTEIACRSAPQPLGSAAFGVLTDGVAAVAPAGMSYLYVDGLFVTSVNPAAGSTAGGSDIRIQGTGFAEMARGNVSFLCRFGDLITNGSLSVDGSIHCQSPRVLFSGSVSLSVVTTAGEVAGGALSFRFIDNVFVFTVAPAYGSSAGGSRVILFGKSFFRASIASCLFGDQVSPAVVLNSSAIECVVPAALTSLDGNNESVSTSVSVGVSLDGYEVWSSGAVFTYVTPIQVIDVQPLIGSTQGGTQVSVTGMGFSTKHHLWCKFGGKMSVARVLSDQRLQCQSPAMATDTSVDLTVLVDEAVITTTSFVFTYSIDPEITFVQPAAALLSGGATVNISGLNFGQFSNAPLYCFFGDKSVMASMLSNTSLSCVVPEGAVEGPIWLSIALKDGSMMSNQLSFKYVSLMAAVLRVQPKTGSIFGGTAVVVYGSSFFRASIASCLFGDQVSPAVVLNSSAIECVVPAALTSLGANNESVSTSVSVGVSLDGYEVRSSSAVFTYVSPARLKSLSPSSGSTQGGTNVSVSGSGFLFGTPLWCMFGEERVRASFVSSDQLWCVSPPQKLGEVDFSVWADGVAAESISAEAFSFEYIVAPSVESVSPSVAYATGQESLLTIKGSNFDVTADAYCIVGDANAAIAKVVNTTTLSCAAPTSNLTGSVTLFVALNNNSTVLSLPFTYLETPTVSYFYPAIAAITGGAVVHVYGAHFALPLKCVFENVGVSIAFTHSNYHLQCRVPAASHAQTTIFAIADVNGYEIFRSPFTFASNPVISNPRFASSSSAVLHLDAIDLTAGAHWSCQLDNFTVPAVAAGSSQVLCDVRGSLWQNVTSLFISDDERGFFSNTITSGISDENSSGETDKSSLLISTSCAQYVCTVNEALIYYSSDDATAACAKLCRQKIANKVTPDLSASSLGAFSGFTATTPPSHSFLSTSILAEEAAAVRKWEQAAAAKRAARGSYKPLQSSQCAINGLTACIVEGSSIESTGKDGYGYNFSSVMASIATADTTYSVPKASQVAGLMSPLMFLAIDSVQPARLTIINNSTWITILGRTFTNSTFCLFNNETYGESVVMSQNWMECAVPAQGVLKTWTVTLSLVDYTTLSVSLNSFLLYYDDMLTFAETEQFALQDSSNTTSVSSAMESAMTPLCLSPTGCDTAPVMLSAFDFENSKTWASFLKMQNPLLNKGDFSLCSSDDNCTVSRNFNYSDKNFNQSYSHAYTNNLMGGESAFANVIDRTFPLKIASAEDEQIVKKVVYMSPTVVQVNSTQNTLYFGGTSFTRQDRWCVKFVGRMTDCFVESLTSLQCTVDMNVPPWTHSVDVLWQCIRTVASFNLTVKASRFSALVAANVSSVTTATGVLTNIPIVDSIRPLAGFIFGSSKIQVTGINMVSVTHCKFALKDEALTVVASLISENSVVCPLPSPGAAGVARILLGFKNSSWINTNSLFTFYLNPTFYSTSGLSANGRILDFDIFGDLFPPTQCYCKVTLLTGSSVILQGQRLSSQLLHCLTGTRVLNSGPIVAVSVSFNGEDFFDVPITAARKVANTSIDFPTLSSTAVEGQGISTMTGIQQPLSQSLLCDGHTPVTLPMECDNLLANFSCLWEGRFIGRAQYIPSIGLLCTPPVSRPDTYTLIAQDQDPLSVCLPQVIKLNCLALPHVFSAVISPRSLDDGRHLLKLWGVNFQPTTSILCEVDGRWRVLAAVDSFSSLLCVLDPLSDGMHTLSIYLGDSVLFKVRTCLSTALLRSGGLIMPSTSCMNDVTSDPLPSPAPKTAVVRTIQLMTPTFGSGKGGSQVAIVGEGINYTSTFICSFGDVNVSARVIDSNRLLCITPATRPSEVSVKVVSSSGDSWCCERFTFIPLMRIVATAPLMVDFRGGQQLYLNFSTALHPATLPLTCFFGERSAAAAFRVDDRSLSCTTPVFSTAFVNVSVGSEQEPLSTVISVPVAVPGESMSLSPGHGRHQGGTVVAVHVMPTWQFVRPVVLFGDLSVPANQTAKGIFKCVTPAVLSIGRVFVKIFDGAFTNAPHFTVDTFFFEKAADTSSISPSTALRGADIDVLVFGSYFTDSALFSCIVGKNLAKVPTRWLSSTTALCQIPGDLTATENLLPISVSNNGQDLSSTFATLHVAMKAPPFLDISPLRGFSIGGTAVSVSFRSPFAGPVMCRFGVANPVDAFQFNDSHYVCRSPPYESVAVDLSILTDADQTIYSTSFTYFPLPRLITAAPAVLQSGVPTVVHFFGEGFNRFIEGRFRRNRGVLINDNRCLVLSATNMSCNVEAPNTNGYLSFDISVNKQDFVNDFSVFQVFQPAIVLTVEPVVVSAHGGDEIIISLTNMQSAFGITCVFDNEGRSVTVAAYRKKDDFLYCLSPASLSLDPAFPSFLSIQQNSHALFGPIQLQVREPPAIAFVEPAVLVTGGITPLFVTFRRPLLIITSMKCSFDGAFYPLALIDSLHGYCSVNPLRSGNHSLKIANYGLLNASNEAFVSVLDVPDDLSTNTTAVTAFALTPVAVMSQACAIPNTSYCSSSSGAALTLFTSACQVVCGTVPRFSDASLRIDLCLNKPCDAPIFSARLDVLNAVSVVAVAPPLGTVLGGRNVTLYGSGFTNDATLQCLFGEAPPVKAVVVSQTSLWCTTPPSAPGNVTVRILRRGLDVSVTAAKFEYVPLLSMVILNTSSVLAPGGTILSITSAARVGAPKSVDCRFEDIIVPAVVLNETAVLCQSPALLRFRSVQFALSSSGQDISSTSQLDVVHPPDVIHLEPLYFSPGSAVDFSLYFSGEVTPTLSFGCALGGVGGRIELDGYTAICSLPAIDKRTLSTQNLTLSLFSTMFYFYPIKARAPLSLLKMFPSSGIVASTTSSVVMLTATLAVDSNDYSSCCFVTTAGTQSFTPMVLISPIEFQCTAPKMDLLSATSLAVGVAGADGLCLPSGFSYLVIPKPVVVAISILSGPKFGGTTVELQFFAALESQRIYCKIGATASEGQIVGDTTAVCTTRPTPTGVYDVEISVNGAEFYPTGYQFEFLDPVVSNKESPLLPSIAPVLFFIAPATVTAGHQPVVSVVGRNFQKGARCLLGAIGLSLETSFISETEVRCKMPVHAPGSEVLVVSNPPSNASQPLFLDFVASGSQSVGDALFVSPSFGPKFYSTVVTVSGFQLGQVSDVVYCRVGYDWSHAMDVTETSVKCMTPTSIVSGNVKVRLANANKEFLPGSALFQYVEDPLIADARPAIGSKGTPLMIRGRGFLHMPELACMLGDTYGETVILDDAIALCTVPELSAGIYSVTFQTNGQHILRSGVEFRYFEQVRMDSLWPSNGPAFRGSTAVTIYGSGFTSSVDMACTFDTTTVPAIVISDDMIRCRAPSHRPGRVNVTITLEGTPLHPLEESLQFVFVPDASVDKLEPEFGYTAGGYPVYVFGTNFLNTSSLGCSFADMKSRGIFLSPNAVLCLAPSPIGRALLSSTSVLVQVTNNGYDYTNSYVWFNYSQPCDAGFYCLGNTRQLCPNGTYCPENSSNFTLCKPGYFQPREGQQNCIVCPVGYICPAHGMTRPIICPAGQICESMILSSPTESCPAGFYCLNGTKATSLSYYTNDSNGINGTSSWSQKDYVTDVISFVPTSYDWSYKTWPLPALGKSRVLHPPYTLCNGYPCDPGSQNFTAEAPYPCPIGHYCRSGVTTQIPIPKNFSTPQRCFDGFFCARGSTSPEGSGPCPNGYFCPTQLDALPCPQGHYCPGVGNRAPIECYPGTFNPFDTRANCTVCPYGFICPGWGLLLPEPCPAGFVCSALGLSFPVVLCPQGYYCAEGTITLDPSAPTTKKPMPCPAGTFCLGGVASPTNIEWIPQQPYGAYHTQTCVEGTYCKVSAYLSSGTGLCFLGHYCPPNSSFPTEVPVGRFSGRLGAVAPTVCFPGTYAPLTGQSSCDVCPAGHTCKGYGNYIPEICPIGTYRMLVDPVSCQLCMTGTFSTEVGAPDISYCLACPPSRVCGVQALTNLNGSIYCPAGYVCGYGTDFTRQFLHKTPAGYFSSNATVPADQYSHPCSAGYYCNRGTPELLQTRSKCQVGYFCPKATPSSSIADIKCSRLTTSISGAPSLESCRISSIAVCDKIYIDPQNPFENMTYYSQFSYTMLDGSGTKIEFDSISDSTSGEVQVTNKIHPVTTQNSTALWVNETIEAFRACPPYGSADGGDVLTIIGRNFKDTKSNFCKFRACFSADNGVHINRCRNRVLSLAGTALPIAGKVSEVTFISKAKYISSTRIECVAPPFTFDKNFSSPQCQHVSLVEGEAPFTYTVQKYAYVRQCASLSTNCMNFPQTGQEYFLNLTLPCSADEIAEGSCLDIPETGYMLNPCFADEVIIEVTNDGEHYSGGDLLNGTRRISTARFGEHEKTYENYKNFTTPATFATYTYVRPEYMYKNASILAMEKQYCLIAKYYEEGPREREIGWFLLQAHEVAHVQVNLTHIPDLMTYGEHYRIALFAIPSRCTYQLCNSATARIRLTAEENVPCMTPMNHSTWFLNTTVAKNVVNNFTVYALDDMIFKVEIHIMYGLFAPYVPLFRNSTTVVVTSPRKARSIDGLDSYGTRQLPSYVSYEMRHVPLQYIFCAVYKFSYTEVIMQSLNMPPRFYDFAYGRALIMYNVSSEVDESKTPLILDSYDSVNLGSSYWYAPSPTASDVKEMLDAYFETFHGMTYDGQQYTYAFTNILLPYLPYFSHCYEYDSYIPIWMMLESKDCALPDTYSKDWYRYKYPALVDQDSVKSVGPFDFLASPIADWCELTIKCNYEEDLPNQATFYRWFEAPTDTEVFELLRYPVDYSQYTGRSDIVPTKKDGGGAKVIASYFAQTEDNFIKVMIDHSAGDAISGCTYLCFPRSYLLEIGYYQSDPHNKRLIYANLIGSEYDFDTTDTSYQLKLSYYALNYIQLFLNFAFDVNVFAILFIFLGMALVIVAFFAWLVNRITTHLLNPPDLKIWSLLTLTVPPPAAGITLAMIPIWIYMSFGNLLIYGVFYTDPQSPTAAAYVDQNSGAYENVPTIVNPIMEVANNGTAFPLTFNALGNTVSNAEMERARTGRIGVVFMMVAFGCFFAGGRFFFPKAETKRELEVARKLSKLATRSDIWNPVLWKKLNFMFASFVCGIVITLLIEFSYWTLFGTYEFTILIVLAIISKFGELVIEHQLQDAILCMPLRCAFTFASCFIIYGSPNFLSFLLAYYFLYGMSVFDRVYLGEILSFAAKMMRRANDMAIQFMISATPKFLKKYVNDFVESYQGDYAERKKREIEGIALSGENAESVEPILASFGNIANDTLVLWYMPFLIYLLMQYRQQIYIPVLYNIHQSTTFTYLVFQIIMIIFKPVADVFNLSQLELFHGWKVYEYLVYSRYRFVQRETKWKGMENSLDECIDESLRRIDQMCFSSQYYMMLTVQVNGIIFVMLALETWLRINYSPFSDSGFALLALFMAAIYIVLEWLFLFFAIRFKLWKTKHENTAWHILQGDDDDLELPDWEDVKGASHDNYLMNQRLTSDTFRYKFLNYNRSWLINQLPNLLTPRTLRRSRPYLLNQLARVLNNRRGDISDDSGDEGKKFGPVALSASSRNIIRWWLAKARRRLRLRQLVDPLVRRARAAECEICLSRRQLQVTYDIDIDRMVEMYDRTYPGDEEVDQVQWKNFWSSHQKYHTICLACLSKQKGSAAVDALRRQGGDDFYDEAPEPYPDWGPVYLSDAARAILLDWYSKARQKRAGKRKTAPRRQKVVKAISDDEGEEEPLPWINRRMQFSAATKAIAVKWTRSARARLQKRAGKGAGLREADRDEGDGNEPPQGFRSGKKSKFLRK